MFLTVGACYVSMFMAKPHRNYSLLSFKYSLFIWRNPVYDPHSCGARTRARLERGALFDRVANPCLALSSTGRARRLCS